MPEGPELLFATSYVLLLKFGHVARLEMPALRGLFNAWRASGQPHAPAWLLDHAPRPHKPARAGRVHLLEFNVRRSL